MPDNRFGIKEVADVVFYELNENGDKKKVALVLDTLKVSNIETSAEQSDAKGGKGNAPLITWDYGREVNLTLQDAVLSEGSLELAYGSKMENGELVISANSFPGVYWIEGETYARDMKTGKDDIFKFAIPRAKIQSENTITMEAEGDPTVFDMNIKALRGKNGAMTKLTKKEQIQPTPELQYEFDKDLGGYIVNIGMTTEVTPDVLVIPDKIKGMPVVGIYNDQYSPPNFTESIILPDSIISIGSRSFTFLNGEFDIPDGVVYIGDNAFNESGIHSIVIPNSVTTIGDWAFSSCNGLRSITIPDSVTSIGENTFTDGGLQNIRIKKPENSIPGAPWGAEGATITWNWDGGEL